MAETSSVALRRTAQHRFTARNDRGAEVQIGRAGQDGSFTPVELLLAAAAGCVAVTAESLVERRIGEGAEIRASAEAVRTPDGHSVVEIPLALDFDVSALDDAQRAALDTAVRRAVEQLCTVTRTLKKPTPAPLDLPTGS
ncbi:OsmC family protein [Umezawaea beigongshangensis]|uniref:OsmC family protein n=1 Tax=Umezawaea beigongshangensis TaxID=2780383 RepID=UPI0027DBE6CC|nr:OsmC family protein [Umezawaea beigongshangensis]